jgi:two-component system repressor protein LuxO
MREGRLREDLYYRLHVVPLRMPAMRERSHDILMLAKDFLNRIAHEEGKDAQNLSDTGVQALRGYSWPGNVRQLENTMRQLLLTSTSTEIDESAIHQVISVNEISVDNAIRSRPSRPSRPSRLAESAMEPSTIQPLWMTEKKTIEEAIAACDGSINRAAQYLEVAPSTIYRKLQSWKAQNLKI